MIGECAKVADALLRGCPNVGLLATSREPLGIDGERVYRVPSLGVPADAADAGIKALNAYALLGAALVGHGRTDPPRAAPSTWRAGLTRPWKEYRRGARWRPRANRTPQHQVRPHRY
jgi:hypothetical protein